MNEIVLITRALRFAAERHSTQRRKGQAKEPYINHLAEVAELVAKATDGKDTNLVVAALLHDTIEDTKTVPEELVAEFNSDIAQLVREVTDDKSLSKQDRKKLQIAKASQKTPRPKLLKLAEKTSNLRSIAHSPPENWDTARKQEYINWATQVVAGLKGVNTWLEARFDKALKLAQHALEMENIFVIKNPETDEVMWIGEEALKEKEKEGWVKEESFQITESSSPEFAEELLGIMKGD